MSNCCAIPKTAAKLLASTCPLCQAKGKPIALLTVRSLVKPEHQSQINSDFPLNSIKGKSGYLFCETPNCPAVYFDGAGNHFDKSHLRVRVGLKETQDPIPVCYCFDFTEKKILDEIAAAGQSTAMSFITQKVQVGECACEIKNPSGRCCLGNVNKVVKRGMAMMVAKQVAPAAAGADRKDCY